MALPSVRSLFAGYSAWSTMEPAPDAILLGKVASDVLRRKTTVFSSGVSMPAIEDSMTAGPASSLIFSVRSKENLTSFEVRLWPLLNFRPVRRTHLNCLLSAPSKPQDCAASGSGVVPPLGKLSSDWKTLLKSSQEPGS